jgi:hypothetical protein
MRTHIVLALGHIGDTYIHSSKACHTDYPHAQVAIDDTKTLSDLSRVLFFFPLIFFFGDTRGIVYINTLILLLNVCSQVVHVLWRHAPAATCVRILHM